MNGLNILYYTHVYREEQEKRIQLVVVEELITRINICLGKAAAATRQSWKKCL